MRSVVEPRNNATMSRGVTKATTGWRRCSLVRACVSRSLPRAVVPIRSRWIPPRAGVERGSTRACRATAARRTDWRRCGNASASQCRAGRSGSSAKASGRIFSATRRATHGGASCAPGRPCVPARARAAMGAECALPPPLRCRAGSRAGARVRRGVPWAGATAPSVEFLLSCRGRD